MCDQHQTLARTLDETKNELAAVRDRALRAEEAKRQAEEKSAAAADLGRALARLLPAGAGSVEAVDLARLTDAVVERVKLLEGLEGGILTQKGIRSLSSRWKSFRSFSGAGDGDGAATARGDPREHLGTAVKTLAEAGFLEIRSLTRCAGSTRWASASCVTHDPPPVARPSRSAIDPKRGVRAATRAKIAGDLSTYRATESEIEAVYQAVLHAIATEGEAAA